MDRPTAERVALVEQVTIRGTFYRHAAPDRDAWAGAAGGRWGASFPVIYLGRPERSAVVEAYRHLVEEAGIRPDMVRPRVLYTARVDVARVLDLGVPENLERVGLTAADLASEVDDYGRCQEVAAAAHQLGFHAILAVAAHGLGETLALFRQRIDADEMPVVLDQTHWQQLPADPRKLRVVEEGERLA